ncbi:hypothetical protein EV356DRAFT_457989, partial [Viridothelium virens]
QGKLAEARRIYTRVLQGRGEVSGTHKSLYIPALNTISNFGNLYSETKRKDKAKTMYTKALTEFVTL